MIVFTALYLGRSMSFVDSVAMGKTDWRKLLATQLTFSNGARLPRAAWAADHRLQACAPNGHFCLFPIKRSRYKPAGRIGKNTCVPYTVGRDSVEPSE